LSKRKIGKKIKKFQKNFRTRNLSKKFKIKWKKLHFGKKFGKINKEKFEIF